MGNMRFALVDLEGATVDAFESYSEARDAVRALLREDASLGDQLLVIEYSEGMPVGAPRAVEEFATPKIDSVLMQGLRGVPKPRVKVALASKSRADVAVGFGAKKQLILGGKDPAIEKLRLARRRSSSGRY